VLVERLPRVARVVVEVVPLRHLDVGVPEHLLDDLDGDARLRQQRAGRVPELVDADVLRDRRNPEGEAALRALRYHARGAADVEAAAPALVVVADDDPGGLKGGPDPLVHVEVAAVHPAVPVREDQHRVG
jgi:hypothetical protein